MKTLFWGKVAIFSVKLTFVCVLQFTFCSEKEIFLVYFLGTYFRHKHDFASGFLFEFSKIRLVFVQDLNMKEVGSVNFLISLILCHLIRDVHSNCRAIEELDYGNFFVPNPLLVTELEGVLTSPNFPNQYNPQEQCGFLIQGPPNSRIRYIDRQE